MAQKHLKQLQQLGLIDAKSTGRGKTSYNITARGLGFLSESYGLQKQSEIAGNKKHMEFFLDTASTEEVKKILPWGILSGLTTNQKIFLQEGGVDFKQRALELISLVKAPVSLELTTNTLSEMVREAREYYSWDPTHVVVKVAMKGDGTGLEAIHELSSEGIPINATVMMTPLQAILAAKAGANYVSLFFNRIRDAGEDPVLAIKKTRTLLDADGLKAKIIAGSIRQPTDVLDAAVAGAHVITIPYKIMAQLPYHSKSEETIREFDKAWQDFLALTNKPMVAQAAQL